MVFTDATLPGETTPAPGKPAAAPRKARSAAEARRTSPDAVTDDAVEPTSPTTSRSPRPRAGADTEGSDG